MIWVKGDMSTIEQMARRTDIAHIYANPSVKLDFPAKESSNNNAIEAIEWNILKVNADDVWQLGYTGQGAVVGGQDTGYDWDHPALKNQYRGWDGNSADHNYNWHDAIHSGGGSCGANSPEPCDDSTHGTHTMGTIVGDDGAGNQIGMAPGARWIGCRNMNLGYGTPESYAECYQWFIAPTDLNDENPNPAMAPHAINNSWSCPPSEGCTDPDVLLAVVDAVRAAGILTAHSAGNAPPSGCESINDPGAIYDSSYTVGAVGNDDTIASWSKRGPVTVDGSNRPKPDISAPGVVVRSSVPGTGYGFKSGTSMAAPHVAGLAALLVSADPSLAGNVDKLEIIMNQTAVHLTSTETCGGVSGDLIPNNTYGYGRIDALSAVTGKFASLSLTKSVYPGTSLEPGDFISYTISITNSGNMTATTTITDTFDSELINPACNGVPGDLSDQQDIVPASSSVYYCIAQVSPALVIKIDKAVDNPTSIGGTSITYTITVTNPNSSTTIENVIVNDTDVGTCFPELTAPIQLEPSASQVYLCPNIKAMQNVTNTAEVTGEVPLINVASASAPEDASSLVSSNSVYSTVHLVALDSASVTVIWPQEIWLPLMIGG